MLSLSEIQQIVIEKTGKSIQSCKPVYLPVIELYALRNNEPLTDVNKVYFGTLAVTTDLQYGLTFTYRNTVDNTSIAFNAKENPTDYPRVFPHLLFDKIQGGELDETIEIVFCGYEFTTTPNQQ